MRLLLTAAFALAACTPTRQAAAPQDPGLIAEGRRLVEIHCARCHATDVGGESRHPMAPPFRTLSRAYPVNTLQEAFAEGILVGHRDMPHFQFEPAQIDAILAYIDSVQERRAG